MDGTQSRPKKGEEVMSCKSNPAGNCKGSAMLVLSKAVRLLSAVAALILLLSLTGCMLSSISESSGSISESSRSSSKSSKSSSAESKESYLRDIRQYTAVYTRANSDMNGLTKGLSVISEKHGVTDWEAYSATYLGIGAGFAKAALTQQQVDAITAFIARGDRNKVAMIQQGFITGW